MKTTLFTFLSLFFCLNLYSQEVKSNSNLFVRVYDLNGNKIYKGKIQQTTPNTLILNAAKGAIEIDVTKVGFIKTKRSMGNNILIGSASGVGLAAILGATSSNSGGWFDYNFGEGLVMGTILFVPVTTGIGALTSLFKNSKTYIINGDVKRWQEVKDLILLKK